MIKKQRKYFIKKNIRRKISRKKKIGGRIHFRANSTNLFVTLTTIKDKVIYTRSTGMCTQEKNKREKLSNKIIEKMANQMAIKIKKKAIRSVEVLLRTKTRRLFRIFLNQMKYQRINIVTISDFRKIPHNGVRGKAKPRK